RRLAWVVGLGLVVLAAGGAGRWWLDQQPPPSAYLPGQPRDPAWLAREQEITRQVEAIRHAPPQLDEQSPHPVEEVAANERPDQSAFRIAEDHRVFDLRAWKPVAAQDGPHTAGVVMTRRLRLSRTGPANRIDFLGRTSGADLM